MKICHPTMGLETDEISREFRKGRLVSNLFRLGIWYHYGYTTSRCDLHVVATTVCFG